MNEKPQLILHAAGAIFGLLVIYTFRDYLVIGLASAGAIFLYKLITESHDQNRRR